MAEENRQIKRETAIKTNIISIEEGTYTKEGGWNPNFITTTAGERMSRVNIMGIVVSEPSEDNNVVLDDGSSRIIVRSFDEDIKLQEFTIGDIVNVIGKPREYMGSKHIIPEVVKKLQNKKWLEVRKNELENKYKNQVIVFKEEVEVKENNMKEEKIEDNSDGDKIIAFIKRNDTGQGVIIEDVVANCGSNSEKNISRMIEQGEIFEIRNGVVKVLE